MACVFEWTRADWGADHVFTSCSWTSGKKGTDVLASALRVDLKYHESSLLLTGSSGGFQVSSNSWTAFDRTLMSSSWRPEGSELPSCSGSDPAQPSFSEAEMDMASSPSSWPKATNPSILEGGAETVLGERDGRMRRPLGSTARQDGAPAARRGGAHQRHAGGSEPDPEQAANHIAAGPEHADREVRAKSTVGLVQRRLGVSQAQAGDAMEMLIQRFNGSRADLTHWSHHEFKVK